MFSDDSVLKVTQGHSEEHQCLYDSTLDGELQ